MPMSQEVIEFKQTYGPDGAVTYWWLEDKVRVAQVPSSRKNAQTCQICSCSPKKREGNFIVQLPTLSTDDSKGPTFVSLFQHSNKECAFKTARRLSDRERVARIVVRRSESYFSIQKIQDSKAGKDTPTYHSSWLIEDIVRSLIQMYPNAHIDVSEI